MRYEYVMQNVLSKFQTYWTCYSKAIVYVLFLEHLQYFEFLSHKTHDFPIIWSLMQFSTCWRTSLFKFHRTLIFLHISHHTGSAQWPVDQLNNPWISSMTRSNKICDSFFFQILLPWKVLRIDQNKNKTWTTSRKNPFLIMTCCNQVYELSE